MVLRTTLLVHIHPYRYDCQCTDFNYYVVTNWASQRTTRYSGSSSAGLQTAVLVIYRCGSLAGDKQTSPSMGLAGCRTFPRMNFDVARTFPRRDVYCIDNAEKTMYTKIHNLDVVAYILSVLLYVWCYK